MAAHILIIEDEEKLARFVELELVHEGYQAGRAFRWRRRTAMICSFWISCFRD